MYARWQILGRSPHSNATRSCLMICRVVQRVSYGSNLREIQQQHCPSLIGRGGVCFLRFLGSGLCRLPLALHNRCECPTHSTGAVQPPTSRQWPWYRLPLLSRLSRNFFFRGGSSDAHLHELPFTVVDGCANACAGSREPRHRPTLALATRKPDSRFRLLQPQHSRSERHRLLNLSRSRR